MTFLKSRSGFISMAALLVVGACTNGATHPVPGSGTGLVPPGAGGDTTGTGGDTTSGTGGDTTTGTGGAAGQPAGTPGTAGDTSGAAGAGTAGTTGTDGGAAGATGGATSGTAGSGAAGDGVPPPPRPINVTGTGVFNKNGMYLDKDKKPIQGKLVLLLGGICTGTGAGGFEAFVEGYGFHVFAPKTDTCLDGGKVPAMYQTTLKTMPNDPEANRQIGDSRMELWDGKSRVTWYTVAPGNVILTQTLAAIQYGMTNDPGGDWGFFLNDDGTLRTTDVWVVGYSWGSQTWAMISAYVNFGRVITTSGPQSEGFPNALWVTSPPATGTPGDRKYILGGLNNPYPSTAANDSEVMGMFMIVSRAGWPGTVTNVLPTSPGPYTSAQHLFGMVGGNGGTTPGGHTVFCNNNPMDGWSPLCKYVLNVQ